MVIEKEAEEIRNDTLNPRGWFKGEFFMEINVSFLHPRHNRSKFSHRRTCGAHFTAVHFLVCRNFYFRELNE